MGNEDFIDSFEPMMILLIGFVVYLLTFWIRQYLLFGNLIQFHAYGRIIYTLTFLVLVIIFTSSYSALGIAFSLSTAMTVQKIFEFTIYRKKIK